MKRLLMTFVLSTFTALAIAQDGPVQDASETNRDRDTMDTALSSMYWSTPVEELPESPYVQDGCYARLFTDKTHDFLALNIIGPAAIHDFDHVVGRDIENDVNYIEVGPNAIVRLFDNTDLVDLRKVLTPGTKYFDEDLLDSIDSLELECAL